jgi:hypothetical protein
MDWKNENQLEMEKKLGELLKDGKRDKRSNVDTRWKRVKELYRRLTRRRNRRKSTMSLKRRDRKLREKLGKLKRLR